MYSPAEQAHPGQRHLCRLLGVHVGTRDAYTVGTAHGLDERLVVADAAFDVPGLADLVDVAFL